MIGELAVPLLNLAESDERLLRETAWRRGQLSELAAAVALALDGEKPASARDFLALSAALLREEGILPASPGDRVELVRFLLREAEGRFGGIVPSSLFGGPFVPPARSRVVLLDNPPSEEAYRRLAPLLASPTAFHRDSLRALCDDVENGYADYAVLPLRAGNAPVATVWAMLEERGLAVSATVCLPGEEDELEVGLASRAPTVPTGADRLAVRFSAEAGEAALLALSAAETLCLRILFSEITPARFGDGTLSCRALLLGGECLAFLAYLALFTKDFTVLGLYTEL